MTCRRETIKNRKREYRELDKTPVEIGVGKRTIPDTREMVRQYVHQALAQAGANKGYETVDEMLKEELDLEPMDQEPAWTSQFEVQELDETADEMVPREAAPPQKSEGEQPSNVQPTESEEPPSS